MFCSYLLINISIFRPTITIENGKSEEKLVPVSQVRPIKKENRKAEEKNNLDVVVADYRRHKSAENKRDKSTEKHKTDHAKSNGVTKREPKLKTDEKNEEKNPKTGARGIDRIRARLLERKLMMTVLKTKK